LAHLVEVAFKGNRKEFFLWDYPDPPPLNAAVIVDVERGEDLGYIHALGELAQKRNGGCSHGCGTSLPERKALRLATEKDRTISKDLERLNEEARRKAMDRVRANNLGMKLSDAEWQWDRKKLTLYFTADKRVDFRNLVRDLASLFRTRIELKQIGVRDEAKRLDGVGRCGRQYCSASWLPELRPVNLGVAKDQRLSLNPSQISGACGRLMCCLRYEHEFYVQSRKRFPKEGKIVATKLGEEKVLSINIFHERVTLRGVEGDLRSLTLAEFNEETGQRGGVSVAVANGDDEDATAEVIYPDEISPELLYTAEHQLPALRDNIVSEHRPEASVRESEGGGPGKRRRGRRGGRRGRGSDESPPGTS
jgi:cell fate regulator YaaT (PSP1 superfamily)